MAKCSKCGIGGLFKKICPDGLCVKCHAAQVQMEAAENARKMAQDAERLLQEAKDAARTEAQKQLAADQAAAERQLQEMYASQLSLQERYNTLTADYEKTAKKLKTAQNKLEKSAGLYESVRYAIENYPNGFPTDRVAVCNLAEVLDEEPPLQCFGMKNLRAKYKKNQKNIVELVEMYQSQYKTKANATIYKLMVLAIQAEINNLLMSLSYGKKEDADRTVTDIIGKYYQIATDGNQTIVSTLTRFIAQLEGLYRESVSIEYEYYVQRERAKEEQRALREQMRQEAEERKALEAQKKQVEKEEKKYIQEMDRIRKQLEETHNSEMDALKQRLADLEKQMQGIHEKKEEIAALQNGKAGTVYVISNIGAFGDDVFKIGMTRRLEPMDRVKELGDASVPFPFDVHSFIFSEDAVSLETALHHELNSRRVNKVNLRKEFFRVSVDELEQLVNRIDPSAPFNRTAAADQYRQSLTIDVPFESYASDDADEDDL